MKVDFNSRLASHRRAKGTLLGGGLLLAALGAACSDTVAVSEPPAPPAPAPSTPPPPPPLGLNDVSVLMPTPASGEEAALLGPTDEGARGPLLPRDVYDAIPTVPPIPEALDYGRMRVVGVRFDGCGGPLGTCTSEIRLVMQPLLDGELRDSALHLFYHLDDAAMGEVVDGLRRLRELAPEAEVDAPLDVHPALVAQGLEGAYAIGLRELLLSFIGQENLVRVTFFQRAPPTVPVWFFGGLDRDEAGTITPMKIPGTNVETQQVVLTLTGRSYTYEVAPDVTRPEDGRALYGTDSAREASDEQREAAMASYLRVEDPTTYAVDDLPCAGCHFSTFVRDEATRRWGTSPDGLPAYSSARSLERRGKAGLTAASLRAFGWFEREPMIAQRTINESAEVLEQLEARFPGSGTTRDP